MTCILQKCQGPEKQRLRKCFKLNSMQLNAPYDPGLDSVLEGEKKANHFFSPMKEISGKIEKFE